MKTDISPVRQNASWLAFRVQLDAFRSAPLAYLQAVMWRARGLRLRSRNRFAALAGRSPLAYRLWITRHEPAAFAAIAAPAGKTGLPIVVAIDCQGSAEGAERTLRTVLAADPQANIAMIGGRGGAQFPQMDTQLGMADLPQTMDGCWLLALQAGDELAPEALKAYRAAAVRCTASVIYADDDLLGPAGERHSPHFKPGWNPVLFRHHDFVSHAGMIRTDREAIAKARGPRWLEAILNAALEGSEADPVHLPLVLHHRCGRPSPVVPSAPAAALDANPPAVTAIIPTRNQLALLRNCMRGIEQCDYPKLDCIIIDNDSDDPETLAYIQAISGRHTVYRFGGPFNFSAMNNAAARMAGGEFLCFVNNDIEMIAPDWLRLMVSQAQDEHVGAVGAKLLYPDETIQHAGVVLGVGGGAAHAHRFTPNRETGYFARAHLPQYVSAVTAACMVVAREKFLAVDGFDETDFPVAFNDVDLCLKLNAQGWQSFYEPRATLVHHESKSRGSDASKQNRGRFAGELAALKRKWNTDGMKDPFHHPHLSPFCEQFLIAV